MSDTPDAVGVPMLGIKSNPLPMPPEMFALIGEIVVLWSRIEATIDMDISNMLRWGVVKALLKGKERPRAFKRKRELWRRAIRELYPKVEVYQRYANDFDAAVQIVSKYRNDLIHGTWSLQPTEHGGFKVTNYNSHIDLTELRPLEVTTEFLGVLVSDMKKVDAHIIGFVASRMLHAHQGMLQVDREP